MKARTFLGKTDDRHRIVIPYANIKRLNKKLGTVIHEWEGCIVECQIKSIRFSSGKKIKF